MEQELLVSINFTFDTADPTQLSVSAHERLVYVKQEVSLLSDFSELCQGPWLFLRRISRRLIDFLSRENSDRQLDDLLQVKLDKYY